ncbi:MAG: hypothetical protein ACYTEZ_20130 [Planctomycetota bacterium]|jgi:hypothetical protein
MGRLRQDGDQEPGKIRKRRRSIAAALLVVVFAAAGGVFLAVDPLSDVQTARRDPRRAEPGRSTSETVPTQAGAPDAEADESRRATREVSSGSDPEALAQVRQRVEEIARSGKRDPHFDVPDDVLKRVDLREVDPPPQFRGTPLEWRLHGKIDPEELAGLLRSLKALGPRDRRAVLHRVFRDPEPSLAVALLQARAQVDGPRWLGLYASAALSMIGRLRRDHDRTPEGVRATLEGPAGDLTQALLDSQARMAKRFGQHMTESQWGWVDTNLLRLERQLRGFDELPRYRPFIDDIRSGVTKILGEAVKPEPNYMGGLAAVRVACRVGDETTWDLLLDLLRARAIFNQKIASTQSRTAVAFLTQAGRTVIRTGNARRWSELATVIIDGLSDRTADKMTRSAFLRLGKALRKALPKGFDPRVTTALEEALASADSARR